MDYPREKRADMNDGGSAYPPPPPYNQNMSGGYAGGYAAPPYPYDVGTDPLVCDNKRGGVPGGAPVYAPMNPSMPGGVVGPQGPPYCAQPIGYGYPGQQVLIVQPTPLSNPPNDYLGYSLFVTICCCWIIGLFAIIKASECRSAIAVGDRMGAELKSRQAKKYANIALGLGIVSVIVTAILLGVYYGMMFNFQR